ncbi:MAG: family 16 glycoside hydrolase, partial [Burkholderiales bacterium]
FKGMTDDEVDDVQARVGQYAVIQGLEFSDGVITAEISGAPAPGAGPGARGFVGIAFRLHDGAYDLFNLRLTNGRAEDQERRNHATQYASHPDWPWFRLRKETPSKYESYVDLVPGQWTKIRIEVDGERARLYVHGNEQPTLMVNDVKSGAGASGGVALWLEPGTMAHFRNLTVKPRYVPRGEK